MVDYSTMKGYKCPHCGLRAASKGPGRSMIPGFKSGAVTALAGMMSMKVEPDPNRGGQNDLVVRMSMWEGDKHTGTREAAIEHLWLLMREVTLQEVQQAMCSHNWQLDPPDQVE